MHADVLIVGAGLTGLACADRLSGAGLSVTVCEKENRLGGLATTYKLGACSFDVGPHELCTEDTATVSFLRKLLGDRLLRRGKRTAQFFRGRLMDYPAPLSKMVASLDLELLLNVTGEVVANRFRRLTIDRPDYTFAQWVESRFGSTLYRTYFGPYTEKVWGLDPDKLDARTASSRISYNSVFDLVVKTVEHFMLGRQFTEETHSPLKSSYYYCRGGIGALCDTLAERCRQQGASLLLNKELRTVAARDGKVVELGFVDGTTVRDFRFLVNTSPLTTFLDAMGLSTRLTPLVYRALVLVCIEVPKRPVTSYSWIYFPDPTTNFQLVTEFTHMDESMAPDGTCGICAEVACFVGDRVWSSTNAELAARVRDGLHKTGILDRDAPCREHVVKVPFAYPVQIAGYLEMVDAMLGPIRGLSNVVTTGRQGLYKYCNMDECLQMAWSVANSIMGGGGRFEYDLGSRWSGASLNQA